MKLIKLEFTIEQIDSIVKALLDKMPEDKIELILAQIAEQIAIYDKSNQKYC